MKQLNNNCQQRVDTEKESWTSQKNEIWLDKTYQERVEETKRQLG